MTKLRLEPNAPMPLTPGLCDWCGCKVGRAPSGVQRSYCSPECRVSYNNQLAKEGKAVMQMLRLWRKHRGRKGTPGEGKISDIAHRVDGFLAADAERKAELARMRDAKA